MGGYRHHICPVCYPGHMYLTEYTYLPDAYRIQVFVDGNLPKDFKGEGLVFNNRVVVLIGDW